MKVLVIGSGGREHALCWKLKESPLVKELFCAPGNPGISEVATNIPLKVSDIDGLCEFALLNKIDLTVVGPELPLSLGVVDVFKAKGLKIFGPTKAAAVLEGSKSFAKDIMISAGVPTARHEVFSDEQSLRSYLAKFGAPIVLKADGLAAGKGVFVCLNEAEIQEAIPQLFGKVKATRVVVEEYLTGREVSYIVATDGTRVFPSASSHDYKRIFDNQTGPNTGGMGSVSPSPFLPAGKEPWVLDNVIAPVLREMKKRGTPFCGFLYAGLMVGDDGSIKVLEFNARMGDPECQVIMRRMETDLAALLMDLSSNTGEVTTIEWCKESAVCVVLAAEGYPDEIKIGDVISGIDAVKQELADVVVFHAGTSRNEQGKLVTSGGRVLGVTAKGNSIEEARAEAYRACSAITYHGKQNRTDIGL